MLSKWLKDSVIVVVVYKMGNITSTDSRRSDGSNNDALAAPEGRPQKRIKLTKTINDVISSPKHTSLVVTIPHLQAVMVLIKLKTMVVILRSLHYQPSVMLWYLSI